MAHRTFASTSGLHFSPIQKTAVGLGILFSLISLPAYAQVSPQDRFPSDDSSDVIVEPESGTQPSPSGSNLFGTRFSCQINNGQYTVMYQPESQPRQMYPWAIPSAMGGGWDPARRCYEISRRLESYRPDGLLEMQTAVENGYNIVCVTTQRVPGCRIVMTVPRGQDPIATRDRVFQNLIIADSGQPTQGVNTFVSGQQSGMLGEAARWLGIGLPGGGRSSIGQSYSNTIDLRPFLDRADGGTAQYLQKGRATTPGRRLNPNKFR